MRLTEKQMRLIVAMQGAADDIRHSHTWWMDDAQREEAECDPMIEALGRIAADCEEIIELSGAETPKLEDTHTDECGS